MSDVDKDTEAITEESDFEGHKKGGRFNANDEPTADETGDDFEGHRKGGRNANEDPTADEGDSDFEGHMKSGRHG